MKDRQQKLLSIIVEEYTKTAQPVGSGFLVEQKKLPVSSATIRNEMAELEQAGYIAQPHTSAGRVPTQKGYQYYVDTFVTKGSLTKKQQATLQESIAQFKKDEPDMIKTLAKTIADSAHLAVFASFGQRSIFYTGLFNLFSQPEFLHHQLVQDMSHVIDHLDQVVSSVYESAEPSVQFLIGENNPFGKDCSTALVRYHGSTGDGLLGVLGPMRMNYQMTYSLIDYSKDLIHNQ